MATTTTTTPTISPFPVLDSAPTTLENDAPNPTFQLEYEGPLYTEINIPLPRIPTSYQPTTTISNSKSTSSSSSSDRSRSRTLTLSRFRQRSSSSATSTSTSTSTSSPKRHSADSARPRRDTVKSREINAMMDLRHQSKKVGRNGVIDALAVVPAVLVLSAELFTPGQEGEAQGKGNSGRRKDSGVGKWEDGIR